MGITKGLEELASGLEEGGKIEKAGEVAPASLSFLSIGIDFALTI